MEKNQLIAIVVLVIATGAAGAYLLMTPPSDTNYYQTQEIEVDETYVIAEGDFDCVDAFFQIRSDGGRIDALWAHITVDGKKYTRYDRYSYEWNKRIYLKFLIHYENNTVSEPYEISIATDYVYDFYVEDVLITVYYKS